MLIPSNDAQNRLFKEDNVDFKYKMVEYIRWHFSDTLGNDVKLLDQPNGLDLISQKYAVKIEA